MKRYVYKGAIIIPLSVILYFFSKPFALCVPKIGLYLNTDASRFFLVAIILLSLCSPFRRYCCNGGAMELAFNLASVELPLIIVFSQQHFFLAVIILMLLAVCGITLFVLLQRKEHRQKPSKRRHHPYRTVFYRCLVLLTVGFCTVPCLLTLIFYGLQSPIYKSEEEKWDELFSKEIVVSVSANTAEIYRENKDLWCCFREDNWNEFTLSEKLDIVQRLVDFESDVLGIPSIIVTAKDDDYYLGAYNADENEIFINVEHLESSSVDEILNTLSHECFHYLQCFLIKVLKSNPALDTVYLQEVRDWMENQKNYKNIWHGVDLYKNQPLEKSAREFAEKETAFIKELINES